MTADFPSDVEPFSFFLLFSFRTNSKANFFMIVYREKENPENQFIKSCFQHFAVCRRRF
jgi:hypothetical protein